MSRLKLYKRYVPYGANTTGYEYAFDVMAPKGYVIFYKGASDGALPERSSRICLGFKGKFHPDDKCYLEKFNDL